MVNNMFVTRFSWLLLLCSLALPIQASTISSVSIAEATNQSALIFEGRVSASRVVRQPDSRVIHTLITFEVLDVLKGDFTDSNIELSFLGGSKGDITMHVADLNRPAMGERGIYFVENPNRNQVNPLYAWDQGHYLLKYQASLGRMAVTTRKGDLIYAVDAKSVAATSALSKGVASGIQISASTSADKPLSAVAFKQQVREMLK